MIGKLTGASPPLVGKQANAPLALLVIEDDADTRGNLVDILEMDGYRVQAAATFAEAVREAPRTDLFAIVLDRKLPDGLAEDLLPQLRQLAPRAAVVIVTGHEDLQGAVTALRLGASDYLLKPVDPDTLRNRLRQLADKRQAEQALLAITNRYQRLVELSPDAIFVNRSDQIVLANRACLRLFGASSADQVLGRSPFEFLDARDHELAQRRVRQVLEGRDSVPVMLQHILRLDQTVVEVECSAAGIEDDGQRASLVIMRDITSRRQMEARMMQTERLAAIGQMMTGLVHESRNALQRSEACLEMLSLNLQGQADSLDLVARVQKAQKKLHQLFEEVRSYAAPIKLQRVEHDLRDVLEETWENLVWVRQGRQASLRFLTEGPSPRCSVDTSRLEQVIRNILENSLAACADPVKIEVTWTATNLDNRPAWQLSIADNGPGLTLEQRQNIFEPFFTTKVNGTGLGMAISQRIVDAHDGTITVGTSRPVGTEIVITLPQA